MATKAALSPAKIIRMAIKLADRDGLSGLSMRRLAAKLKVEAMSIYYHFKNKDEILDALADQIFAEIEWDESSADWKDAMRQRAKSMRLVLRHHPWATGLLDSRKSPGPMNLGHHNAVLGNLRRAGFSLASVAHAYALIDSYIYGFVLQEQSLPGNSREEFQLMASEMTKQLPADLYPYLHELAVLHVSQPGYAFADEFEFGLNLVLEAVSSLRE